LPTHFSKIIKKAGTEDLQGYCAIASAIAQRMLLSEGYDSLICYNKNHVFNLVGKAIIDITAGQFDTKLTKKFIFSAEYRDNFHEYDITFKNPVELALFQQKKGWPLHQMVLEEHLNEA
jgi:hypothetical protein